MTDRDPIWDALKEHSKSKFDADRERFMAQAIEHDDGGWTKHTEYHWSRTVGGKRLDYWPTLSGRREHAAASLRPVAK